MLSQDKKSRFAFNGTALALIAAFGPGLVFGPSAQAQAPTPTPTPKASTAPVAVEDDGEEIIVTGTSVRGVAAVGSEAITLDREAIEATGMTNVRDVLGTLTQFSNNFAGGASETLNTDGAPGSNPTNAVGQVNAVITQPTFGANANGINGINLRGLGNGATMVLINGFRTVSSGAESTIDVSTIPVSALQRIDVIADGVSAVYGSDAIAGVVNFVLRKDYKGVEAGVRHTWQDGSESDGFNVTMGTGWSLFGGGSALLTLDYDHRGALPQGSNAYLRADKSALGGLNMFGLGGSNTPTSLSPYIVTNNSTSPVPGSPAAYCGSAATVNPKTSPLYLDVGRCGNGLPILYYAVSPVTGSTKPTTAQELAAGQPVFVDDADYTDALGARFQRSATLTGRQEINDILALRVQANYSIRETKTRGFASMTTLISNTGTTQPYYITGLVPGNAPYNVITPLGVRMNRTFNWVANTATALDIKLPGDWQGEASYTYNMSRDIIGAIFQPFRAKGDGLQTAPAALVLAEANAGRFNYYSNTNVLNETSAITGEPTSKSRDIYTAARFKLDGPLFSLPGGQVKAALGVEQSKEIADRDTSTWGSIGGVTYGPTGQQDSDLDQTINSYFAEVHVPIISDMNKFPLFESLEFSAAVRTDDYSQFGKTTNPKYGLSWEPHKDLALRASYGTAFRSPGLQNTSSNPTDVNVIGTAQALFTNSTTSASSYFKYGCPTSGVCTSPHQVQTILFVGRKQQLLPETSKNKQFGFDYSPSWFEGAKLSATWYSIDYKNKIDSPNYRTYLSSDELATAYASQIFVVNQDPVASAACAAGTPSVAKLDPELVNQIGVEAAQNIVSPPVGSFNTTFCTAPLIFDGRISNLASQLQEGYDATLSYRKNTDLGQFNVSATLTKITKVDAKAAQNGPTLANVVDVVGGVMSTRIRANVGWSAAGFSATLSGNYVGPYSNNRNAVLNGVVMPTYEIGSNITYDLNLGYRFGEGTGPLEGLRASLGIVNLLDNNPPYVFSGTAVYDSTYADPYGRIFNLRLTKDF